MKKFVITSASGNEYFLRVGHMVGGTTAISTSEQFAKIFKTRVAAQKVLDKWNGAGVGMEFFTEIKELQK